VWWHKDVHFSNIFGLNMKMFISLSLCGGTKTYIFFKYIRVKYEDVYFLVFVCWQNDVHFCNIFGLNIKMFISCLCVVAQRRAFMQYIWVKYKDVCFFVFVWWHKDIHFPNIFGLNMKILISLSLCGGTKT
jgi:hypothetical protein